MNNEVILMEYTKPKYDRKYRCPYCDYKDIKTKLVDHIDNEHKDMIPKEYTAARVVFNLVNKKEHGTCVIDKKETPWNENTWRYERFCCAECKKKASELAKHNMINIYGKEHLLNDPEYQEKMLKGRSISGSYKFTNGGTVDYVGSYEMKLLKFMDTVMGFKASDITSPGPVIPYMYNGEEHFWITDFYLEPFNLVFDVKDGGDNPNNRDMKEYREKQREKEDAIVHQGKYNYIRLTNNNFSQLMEVLAELKAIMMNVHEDAGPLIRINESFFNSSLENNSYRSIDELCGTVMGAMVGINKNPSTYIVPYIKKGTYIEDYAITDDPSLDHILITDEDKKIIPKSGNFLKEECFSYKIYKYTKPVFENKLDFDPSNLLELATGKRILHPDQLYYDKDFQSVFGVENMLNMTEECLEATLSAPKYKVPVMEENYIPELMFYQDDNGYFVENANTKLRSKSFNSLNEITSNSELIKYISEGNI